MRFEDPAPDRDLGDALRQFDPMPSTSEWKLGVLARRIVSRAGPLLNRRRQTGTAWWQYAGVWARTLIPLGITTTLVAVACILWATLAPLPVPSQRVAMRESANGAVANDVLSDGLLDALVIPVERAARPARDRK
jgi:hypothetical protein